MLRGAKVTLITGPTNLEKPMFVDCIEVTTAKEMFEAVKEHYSEADYIIKSAAVADYRPSQVAQDKIKKQEGEASISLERTDDILAYLGAHKKPGQIICGFSMETKDLIENSKAKLKKKNVDMIVANNVKVEGAGFGTDTNVVTLITEQEIKNLPLLSKQEVADEILTKIQTL